MTKEYRARAGDLDKIIGLNLKIARLSNALSQEDLASHHDIDLSIQQIQKYEKGINRVSLARAKTFTKILNIKLDDFFNTEHSEETITAFSVTEEISESELLSLIVAFRAIKDKDVRARAVEKVKEIATAFGD